MSTVYTYSDARQKLAELLERALQDGEVKIRRRDGQTFVIRPEAKRGSPLDVEVVDLGVNLEEIIEAIHEGRREFDEE